MVKQMAGQGYGARRAARKASIRKALMRLYYQRGFTNLSCGELARKLGLKSSTYLKSVVEEMAKEDQQIYIDLMSGKWRVFWIPLEQMRLPDRFITINRKSFKVAAWVCVK